MIFSKPKGKDKSIEELATESAKKSIPMLDKTVWLCVVMGAVITAVPLVEWLITGEPVSDSYYQYAFAFWGGELIANVVIYAIKTLVTLTGSKVLQNLKTEKVNEDSVSDALG